MRHWFRRAPLWITGLSIIISAFTALIIPLPEPQFHDEFSYRLAGDTLAQGRLTNPPHKMGVFFESFQVLQRPTYMSKYPPGQGLVLGLGQAVFGHPIAGVWLSTAVAATAVWWAMRAMIPRRWALFGGILVATHPLMLSWNWSYWGGGLTVTGGAMLIGGMVRLARRRCMGSGVELGAGLSILLITRPFEGAVLVILMTLAWLLSGSRGRAFKSGNPIRPPGRRGGLLSFCRPLAIGTGILLATGVWVGYYNWRVTGSPAHLPYLVYEQAYAVTPPFIWLPRRQETPVYPHAVMRDYYLEWELPAYLRQRTLSGLVQAMAEKSWSFLRSYLASAVLVVPLLAAAWLYRHDRRARLAGAVAGAFTLVTFGNLWFFPHYAAPAAALYLLIVLQGVRHLRARWGRWACMVVLTLHLLAAATWLTTRDRSREGWNFARADLIASAAASGEKHLLIVRPGPGYYAHNEWVYNDADIDASPVVWARDMGDEENRALLNYFSDRRAILLEIGATGMRFSEYGP
jgi:hypothetical protein